MSTKYATDQDKSADRPSRSTPTNRISTPYEVVAADGVTNPDTTKPQFERKHETVADKDAIKAGAHKPGTIGEDRSVSYETGAESAGRRAKHVLAERKKTEQVFAAHRKASSIVRRMK